MKRIYILSLIAVLFVGITGCGDDFLEVQPTEFLSAEQVAEAAENNPDVVAGSVAGIYTLMFETGTGGTNLDHDDFGQKGYDIFSDFLSSDMALSASAYGWYRRTCELTETVDYTNNTNYKPWRYYYRLIRSANTVIATLGGNDVIPENDENKHLMGQAKALRAYCYFYLTQFYALEYEPSKEILPIYTDPSQPNQAKSTTAEVFALMESDLTDAISLLENFTRTGKHQVNKFVAKGLLAYVYASMGDEKLSEAKSMTEDVISNGGFTLMDSTEVVYTGDASIGGFRDVSTPGWIWGVDLTLDNGLDLVSWWGQMDIFTYSYQMAGDKKSMDIGLYNSIPDNDIRKGQFYPDPSSSNYLIPFNKFYPADRTTGAQRNIETDYVYMRVAEMYLLNAEVSAKLGQDEAARASLKEVVSHRMADASYIDGLSGQALQDEIYLQTRIELWGEGKSYLAMKRNKATTVRGSNHLSLQGESIPYNDPRLTFEIPIEEIQNNPLMDSGNK
ncbi:RagB/SusD family nutrient uptake outer membrane protein [uncultured Draconibacterium sp.]|uniref:RagB/SusD family nutrient uptake outer membrane protein n=1 Tax=uncultured Draconibacterium sp. TaxID=1573823 RepID=UPI0025D90333|nr:RagB/SusD family nutrient uptake outer membrane protein [uncultured Draconibacterium sp.]